MRNKVNRSFCQIVKDPWNATDEQLAELCSFTLQLSPRDQIDFWHVFTKTMLTILGRTRDDWKLSWKLMNGTFGISSKDPMKRMPHVLIFAWDKKTGKPTKNEELMIYLSPNVPGRPLAETRPDITAWMKEIEDLRCE